MNRNQSLNADWREELLGQAAEKYFKLYLADWANRQQLSREARQELAEILKDSFFFMEAFVEESEEELDLQEPEYGAELPSVNAREIPLNGAEKPIPR